MLAEERKKYICDEINKRKSIKVSQLSKELGLTEATIRRDLDELQNEKKLRRTHGGAISLYPVGVNHVISHLTTINVEEKKTYCSKSISFYRRGRYIAIGCIKYSARTL